MEAVAAKATAAAAVRSAAEEEELARLRAGDHIPHRIWQYDLNPFNELPGQDINKTKTKRNRSKTHTKYPVTLTLTLTLTTTLYARIVLFVIT